MIKYLKKLLYILPANKVDLLFAAFIFVFTSCIAALGIGIIGPFIALANDFSVIDTMPILARVRELTGIEQPNQFVAAIGLFAIAVFLCKTITSWATQVFITRFSDRQQRLLIIRMANGYLNAP